MPQINTQRTGFSWTSYRGVNNYLVLLNCVTYCVWFPTLDSLDNCVLSMKLSRAS